MRHFVLLTLTAWLLLLGSAQARVVSSTVDTGDWNAPNVGALLIHPNHAAIFEVRASPDVPVDVSWRMHCRSKVQDRVAKHRITTRKLPLRIGIPVIVKRPRYCYLSGEASFKSFEQHGRIGVFIRY
jgi:hypothetical protein